MNELSTLLEGNLIHSYMITHYINRNLIDIRVESHKLLDNNEG